MDKQRRYFETLGIIDNLLKENTGIYYCEKRNKYFDNEAIFYNNISFLNGAWFAWQASSIPDGYVVVPKEPTEEMIKAINTKEILSVEDVYKAMIEAVEKN